MPGLRNRGDGTIHRPGKARVLTTAIALSGAASVALVRLATPATLDEKLTAVALFFILPAFVILALGAIRRALGVLLAILLPFFWLVVSLDSSDKVLLFLLPVLAGALIALIARGIFGTEPPLKILGAAIVLGAVVLLWPVPNRQGIAPRVLVIGIDGATWEIIDPLVSAGRMPNFARLLEGGHRAKLRSLKSMFSPQVWTTMATGCPPKAHGILTFAARKSDMLVGTIWDQMKLEGRSFGLCNWYFTWPPEPGLEQVDFIIPSGFAPDSRTFPPKYSFYRELFELEKARERRGIRARIAAYASHALAAWRHGVRLSTLRGACVELLSRKLGSRRPLDTTWRAWALSVAVTGDVFSHLIGTRGPEFAAVLFVETDRVSHNYWRFMEPEKFPEVTASERGRYGKVIEDIYVEIDRAIGRILERAPKDADVLIISDHGFQAATNGDDSEHRRVRIWKVIEELGLEESLLGANMGKDIYLWPVSYAQETRDRVLVVAEEMLRRARFADDGARLFTVTREEESLHLLLVQDPHPAGDARVLLGNKEYSLEYFLSSPSHRGSMSGTHHPDGIYLLSGPSAVRASGADSLHVLDVAPTLAALLGLPLSPQWPGRPALEGLDLGDFEVAEYARPSGTESPARRIDRELMQKLRALGYME